MKSLVILSLLVAAAIALPVQFEEDDDLFEGIAKRISGGEIAKVGQFPYQVRLRLNILHWTGRVITSRCGGSLISKRAILTAAHCLEMASSAIVYIGSTVVDSTEPTCLEMKVGGRNMFIHNGWNRDKYVNDIGIIILPKDVEFNDAVQPVNLPKSNDDDFVGRTGIISGFGTTENGSSSQLRYVPRRIMEARVCQSSYRNLFKNTHVCVDGREGKGACTGDSGGPLVVENSDGTRTITGVTSFGSSSCGTGSPIVYTRVSSYLDWIHKIIDN